VIDVVRYRDILRLTALGFDKSEVAAACGCHRNTVANVLKHAEAKGISWPLPEGMGDAQIYNLLWPGKSKKEEFAEPDWALVQSELKKKHVTLNLLWQEYRDECAADGKVAYQRSAFNEHYAKWTEKNDAIMHIEHRPAERLEVDWAGTTMRLVDRDTGEMLPVYVFVACLPYSKLVYAEGFLSMASEQWLNAHVNVFNFIGGVPLAVIPDNLKTGVVSRNKSGPVINKSYAQLAEYYGCAVIPTRVRKPRDKSSVEAAVGLVSRRATSALRNEAFYTLVELNAALREKINEINTAPFTKHPGNRKDTFNSAEKGALLPLPAKPFDICHWEAATVQSNYHVLVDKSSYSVPAEYIKRKVDVRITATTVEIFYGGQRIAMHPRCFTPFTFMTSPSHMPEDHLLWASNGLEGTLAQADDIGRFTSMAVRAIAAAQENPQIALGGATRLLHLGRRYGIERLERSCERAIELNGHAHNVSVDMVGYLLEMDYLRSDHDDDDDDGALLRGSEYFSGGKSGDKDE
jgi:transposase